MEKNKKKKKQKEKKRKKKKKKKKTKKNGKKKTKKKKRTAQRFTVDLHSETLSSFSFFLIPKEKDEKKLKKKSLDSFHLSMITS